jgi:hypothetical protein
MADRKRSSKMAEQTTAVAGDTIPTVFVTRKQVLGALEKLTGLKITMRTFDLWHQQRQGPRRHRLGGKILYKVSDLQEWLEKSVEGRGRK